MDAWNYGSSSVKEDPSGVEELAGSLFGNPAVREPVALTRGFAPHPHGWFALVGERSSRTHDSRVCARFVRSHGGSPRFLTSRHLSLGSAAWRGYRLRNP